MKLNYIDDIRVSSDEDVHAKDESILLVQSLFPPVRLD